jgi:hypothetical protein
MNEELMVSEEAKKEGGVVRHILIIMPHPNQEY